MEYDRVSLEDWQRNQPLSVLQLDKADRIVLRIAGKVSLLSSVLSLLVDECVCVLCPVFGHLSQVTH